MNELIARIIGQEWHDGFCPRAVERGFKYAGEGRVQIVTVDNDAVRALCSGSGSNVYAQIIALGTAGPYGPSLNCGCSCPVGFKCKHTAAVIFHLRDLSRESQQVISDRLSPKIERWLNSIPAPSSEIETFAKSTKTRVLYKLQSCPLSGQWSLAVFTARVLKNGDLSEIKAVYALDDLLIREPAYLLELDKRIGRLLLLGATYHHYGSSFPLEGYPGAQVVELALKTERLFYDFNPIQALKAGPTQTVHFRWSEQSNGNYLPQWQSGDQPFNDILALQPLYYLDRTCMAIGQLEHGLDEALARHMCQLPEIPAEQVALFSQRISAVASAVPTPLKLTERIIDDIEPQAYLTLGSHEFDAYSSAYRQHMPTLEHRAALAYRYGGCLTSDKVSTEILLLSGTETQRIQRKPAAEKALRKALVKCGFAKVNRKTTALPDCTGEMFHQTSDEGWLSFVQTHLPVLREAGWEVIVQPGFYYDLEAVDHWYADIEEAPGHEWFDLELGIEVNGQRHSLLPIVLSLMRRQPQLLDATFMAERNDDDRLLVSLGTGEKIKVALPYGRIKPLMATLGALYLHKPEGDLLRLNAPDAARLSDLEGIPLVWQGGERLRSFAKRLKESTHIQIVAPQGLTAELRGYQLEGLNWSKPCASWKSAASWATTWGLAKPYKPSRTCSTKNRPAAC